MELPVLTEPPPGSKIMVLLIIALLIEKEVEQLAVKNHALDDRIVEAAREEFLAHGFRGASLHKIAARAELTTGALYTRYKSKDDLFCSLVQNVLEQAKKVTAPMAEAYRQAQSSGRPEDILQVIRREEEVYRELLFRDTEGCILFFCRSEGSSIGELLKNMMEQKSAETVEYLRSIAKRDVDLDGVGMLMSGQFDYFRQILERGYSREKALSCMKTVELYMDAGWKAIFEAIL